MRSVDNLQLSENWCCMRLICVGLQ